MTHQIAVKQDRFHKLLAYSIHRYPEIIIFGLNIFSLWLVDTGVTLEVITHEILLHLIHHYTHIVALPLFLIPFI
jgi:hypothetical protein